MSVNDLPTDDKFFDNNMEENQSQESDNFDSDNNSDHSYTTEVQNIGSMDGDQASKGVPMNSNSQPANVDNSNPKMKTTADLLKEAASNGKKYIAAGMINEAIHEFIRAMTLTRVIFGSMHWQLAASYVSLAETYLQGKGFTAQAEYHAERAKSLMLDSNIHIATNNADKLSMYNMLVNLHHILAVTKCSEKKYVESEKNLLKAESFLENLKKLPSSDSKLVQMWAIKLTLDFAQLYSKQKKQTEAEDTYKQVVELIEAAHGEGSPQLIALYLDWGKFVQQGGKRANFHQSIKLFQKAHSIATANRNQNELINTGLMLAQTYMLLAEDDAYVSAETYLRECLTISNAVHGEKHHKTLIVEDELVRVLLKTNRRQEALKILQSGITRKCAVHGYYSEKVSNAHSLIASVHLADGDIVTALKSHQQCFEIQKFVLGPKHKKTINSKSTIDILKTNLSVPPKLFSP
ncbi:tetratricopeptide repeat protein 23 [Octopus bimaculoides]|uniref:MalT-like TPR region domain-containing protein n=1 Tax=Octopus bimaculoides TaxID=37653 RepID=A0A0L8GXW1_OCTBM|nr:tetratricopeptide repeat protein 23 [Octopus bimaculoides]XP_014777219.1 tetratricopeptide repeat protein 23 [Octopus bimaculoides]XP_014777220.1 tetratricopeptide repeat protein 23 [Octopus bimaculoides]XP_052826607.1 tetratricopeptide repeat protein 23 [Octopus bimaculoides]|eukprot:XP_014777218.1 PREDICTED: tetratricopeptide repeat protein 23-like isoform X1 [Octopus bimaculoides]